MRDDALFWLGATIFWTLVMSFFSTQEMASISFNKLRLQYYVKENKRFAIWLQYLLDRPTILFSTTLIGVNCALMASSECARRLYEALSLNPNLAPITHIPFVLLFGELVPMFAARIHAEQMCRFGIGPLYLSSKLLSPFVAVVDFFFKNISRYTGKKADKEAGYFLTREELQKLIEEHETGATGETEDQLSDVIGNIFSLKNNLAFQLMQDFSIAPCVSSHATVQEVRSIIVKQPKDFVFVFHRMPTKILGIVFIQSLLHEAAHKRIDEYIEPVTFVSENTATAKLLLELPFKKQSVAIVLSNRGIPRGFITLDILYDELFGEEKEATQVTKLSRVGYLEKTFPANTKIADFNAAYGFEIDAQGCKTFSELIEQTLSRNPSVNDSLFIDPIEIIVKETSLFKAEKILIRTKT